MPTTRERFPDRTVVITGGANGIGARTAHRFAAAGARVVICDIDGDACRRTAGGIPEAVAVRADITSRTDLAAVVDAALDATGRIDVWVNNAMSCTDVGYLEMAESDLRRDLDVTFVAPFLAGQLVVPVMRRQGSGVIVNVASVNGLTYLGNDAYSAAKAALISLTKGIAVRYGGDGLRCLAIAPGTIATEYWQCRADQDPAVLDNAARHYPLGRVGTPDDIANMILFAASDEASWVTGTTLVVDGGLLAGNLDMARGLVPAEREGQR